jgi:hypothetical protein
MNNFPFSIEVACSQKSHFEERICGDVFLSKKTEGKQRAIVALSDGMGHGVKANILATLTSTMALSLTEEHNNPNSIGQIIMKTLPICSQRQTSYSTFTIIDINLNKEVTIIEYDNPQTLTLRGKEIFEPEWHCIIPEGERRKTNKEILTCSFTPQKEDRIIFWTDGITQSGIGTEDSPTGWGIKNAIDFVRKTVRAEPHISAQKLAAKVVNMATVNDEGLLKDDASCVVIYLRTPRKLLICSGPPFDPENDRLLACKIRDFDGRKAICGATTANIVSREFRQPITDSLYSTDHELPPTSTMQGVDLITEGILTLGKTLLLLDKYSDKVPLSTGPADELAKLIIDSDEITFIVGTRINEANQDPRLPVELEMRRTLIKKIKDLLELKFLKDVDVEYI